MILFMAISDELPDDPEQLLREAAALVREGFVPRDFDWNIFGINGDAIERELYQINKSDYIPPTGETENR